MLEVFMVFCYMTLTCFVVGFVVSRLLNSVLKGQSQQDLVAILFTGIVCMTVYAQFFSLFSGVGKNANLILIVLCLLLILFWRRPLFQYMIDVLGEGPIFFKFLFLFLMFFYAYGTSHGYIHYDTSLYHAQSIRWIEEYGILKGLGNVYIRLAYNSSAFSLTALYSMAFLGGKSLHCTAGYMAFLLMVCCIRPIFYRKEKKIILSDFARMAAIYYLLNIFDEMVSPASDYFTLITIFYLIIRWLDLLEEKETSAGPYAQLCILGVFALTLKLTAALILLLTLRPAVQLLKEKRYWQSIVYLFLGFFTAVPYLIRNVIISGYLIYPFSRLDLFQVDWKIPSFMVNHDAQEIEVWGKGLYDVNLEGLPFSKWFFIWFMQLGLTSRILLLLAFTAGILACCYCAYAFVHKSYDLPLLFITLIVSFLFWLNTAPLIRYGCVYIYLLISIVFGFFYLKFFPKRTYIFYVSILILVSYKSYQFGKELYTQYNSVYLVYQEDYENFRVNSTKIGDYIFFQPSESDRTGYDSFPVTHNLGGFLLRSQDIKDGFKPLTNDSVSLEVNESVVKQ